MARKAARRAYESPLRKAQAARTRELLLETTRSILETEGLAALTLPRLAQLANVSPPTVYRHFATLGELLAAFLQWLRPRLGMTVERLLEGGTDQVLALASENYPKFEEHGLALRGAMDSPEWNRIRVGSVDDRAARAAQIFRPKARAWSERDLRGAVGTLFALSSPHSWRWFRDTWGLSPDEARRAATWAVRALERAIVEGPPSLDAEDEKTTKRAKRGGKR